MRTWGQYFLKNLSNADKQKHLQCFNQAETIIPPFEWVSESRSVLSDSLWPRGLYSPWDSPGQNTGVGSFSLLQGIFPTHGSNPGLPHCRQILYQLSHRGSRGIPPYIQTKSSWKTVLLFWQISSKPNGPFYQDINSTINCQAWTSITLTSGLWYWITWRRPWTPTPVCSPGEPHGQRSLRHGVAESRTRLGN